MSDKELLELPVIRPEHAARYLQNGTSESSHMAGLFFYARERDDFAFSVGMA